MALLTATTLLPLLGALIIWAMAEAGRPAVRQVALWTTLVTLALAGYLVVGHLTADAGQVDYGTGWSWLEPTAEGSRQAGLDIRFALGLDGLSFWFYGLSALLLVSSVLVSWQAIEERPAAYYSLLLLLETGLLGVFAARDIILFYVFFEFTLIPLFFLIGIWGSENRRYAAIKFFLFTLAGSLLTFLGLLAIVLWNYYDSGSGVMTFSIPELTRALTESPIDAAPAFLGYEWNVQVFIFLALFAGFAIKVPLFPLHTWLPLAHVQAPTAGSVLLAGVLLKVGTYGFLRFSVALLPEAAAICAPWILWLAVMGILYGALVALAQQNMKSLIAYSSVSHLAFCMLGLFALNPLGVDGATLQMINHGLSTGGLFAIVGMLYERYHTREISAYGGLALRLPLLAFFLVVFTFSSIGVPGLNGFAGEFLLLAGMFQRGFSGEWSVGGHQLQWIAVLAVSGIVLNAWYMLWFVKRVLFGPLKEPTVVTATAHHHPAVKDLSLREVCVLAPLLVFILWIGVHPQSFLTPMTPTLDTLTAAAEKQFAQHWSVTPAAGTSAAAPSAARGQGPPGSLVSATAAAAGEAADVR